MFGVFNTFLCLLLAQCITSEVFLQTKDANQVFTRRRRANSIFEELKKGDMERECREERCSFEEAREIFEDNEKTNEFWNVYHDGDACLSQPCLNKGVCKDGIGRYTCFCPAVYQGSNCEIAIPLLCEDKNGGCDHFCKVMKETSVCSCAKGYKLAADGKSCYSDEPFKCGHVFPKPTRSLIIHDPEENDNSTGNATVHANGTDTSAKNLVNTTSSPQDLAHIDNVLGLDLEKLSPVTYVEEIPVIPERAGDTRIVNGEDCAPGDCPWQALLVNEDKIGFCGGTILNKYFILSAAHCMNLSRSITVVLGEFDTRRREGREATHAVEQVLVHREYVPETYHNDIALIKLVKPITFTKYILPACLPERDFAERVLMQQKEGMVSGFGRLSEGGPQATVLQKLTVPYIARTTCMESTKFKITLRMFCAGYDQVAKDACQGDSGGPHVTRYKDTWFVTGVVSWGEGCARKGKYGVYTQVSKYHKWIESVMDRVMPKNKDTEKARKKREVPVYPPVIRV
ncbi:coagulation factor X [Trichomycterus rosablanca]|uniref:coagulation factor X n=1 Tax=Trichomycterus rosablanca TaxID=2290929 RepID=UPI002F3549C9